MRVIVAPYYEIFSWDTLELFLPKCNFITGVFKYIKGANAVSFSPWIKAEFFV